VSDQTITFLVLAAVVVVFIADFLPVAVVAVGTALLLWATGVLNLPTALAGFGDPAVLFIASLFVVSESRARLLVLLLLLTAALAALISVNGAVAALLPVAVVTTMRLRRSPSQLLLPLAFAAHAGSLLTLSGSPVNVIASEFTSDADAGELRLLLLRSRRCAARRRHDRARSPVRRAAAAASSSALQLARLRRARADARRPVRPR